MSILSSRALAIGLFLLLAAHTADAQLVQGDRIRLVHSADTNVVNMGTLISVTGDSVIFRDDSTHAIAALARDSILAVERRTVVGRRALRGAGIGFLVGAGTGAIGGAASTSCGAGTSECWQGFAAAFFGLVGGLVGFVGGAVIGANVDHEEWMPVALPPR